MLCEINAWGNLPAVWLAITALAAVGITGMSAVVFRLYYVNPSYEMWRYKSNPKYPTVMMVKEEIQQMFKGMFTATLCPALTLWMTTKGYSQAYCGVSEAHGASHLFLEFGVIWIGTDFFEFFYHWLGHRLSFMWAVHKHHHVFYNPSPFAVIADEYLDQFVRSTPLCLLPMIMPINIDLMFGVYVIFFYGYGVYLHWGYELEMLPADHPFINTSFQHYLHHAISVKNKPYHTGFFFKIWDQMFGSIYEGDVVISAMEARKQGLRTREAFDAIEKPDYSPLLSPSFWLKGEVEDTPAMAESKKKM